MFSWHHIRHLNLMPKNPQSIIKKDKKMVSNLSYEGIEFSVSRKDYRKIEKQNNIYINVFRYENGLTYPIYASDETFSDFIALLLIFDEK